MKFSLVFLSLLLGLSLAAQDKIQWMSLEEAEKALKKEPRKIIVDVYTNWCGWCKRMDASTFSHPTIVKYINENYYAVKFNAEGLEDITFKGQTYTNRNKEDRRPTHELAGIAAVNGRLSYPTIVYMDENLDLLQQIPGYVDAKGLEPIIHFFGENAYKKTAWPDFLKNFQSAIE